MYENIDLPFICGINCTDWDSSVTAKQRAEKILNTVQDGDIILLHDFSGNTNTIDALDTIIQGLLDQGYELVTVSKLFELKGVNPNQEYQIRLMQFCTSLFLWWKYTSICCIIESIGLKQNLQKVVFH